MGKLLGIVGIGQLTSTGLGTGGYIVLALAIVGAGYLLTSHLSGKSGTGRFDGYDDYAHDLIP